MKHFFTITFFILLLNSKATGQILACEDNVVVNIYGVNTTIPITHLTVGYVHDPADLTISLIDISTNTPLSAPDSSLALSCSTLGNFIYKLEYQSSSNNCWGNIEIIDPLQLCGQAIDYFPLIIQGRNQDYNYAQSVKLNGNTLLTLGADNIYKIPKNLILPTGNHFTFEPDSVARFQKITTLDRFITSAIITEMTQTTPLQIISSDFNNSNSVNVEDLVLIESHVLGQDLASPVRSYIHESNLSIADHSNFGHNVYDFEFDAVDTSSTNFIFYPIVGGDSNGGHGRVSNDKNYNRNRMTIKCVDKSLTKGVVNEIELKMTNTIEVGALQLGLALSDAAFVDIIHDFVDGDYLVNLKSTDSKMVFIPFGQHDVVKITLKIIPEKDAKVSDVLHLIDAFNSEYATMDQNSGQIQLDIQQTTSTNDAFSDVLSIYPNPTTDGLFIRQESDLTDLPYHISNVHGKVVSQGIIAKNQTYIDLDNLPSGSYFISLQILDTNKTIAFNKL